MKTRFFKLCFYVLLFSSPAFSEKINKVIDCKTSDINFQKISINNMDYDIALINDCSLAHILGAPMLPQKIVRFVIPAGAVIRDFKVVISKQEKLAGEYNILPAQPPVALSSQTLPEWENPDSKIYNKDSYFPDNLISYSNTGNMGGYRIASFLVSPLQYNPITKSLLLNSKCEIQVTYKIESNPVTSKTTYQKHLFYNILKDKVANPENLNLFSPSSKTMLSDTIEYVIITVDSFVSSFQTLADWKTKKGVPTAIIKLDSIYSNFSGRDNPEKIRNFIKYANTNWGTIWVLLGGQCDFENNQLIVPRRDVYYFTSGSTTYNDVDTIPADLYFSDLDRTWNDDNDSRWGERLKNPTQGDTVDFYADVFVGRAPVRTKTQVQAFVNKVLTYEKTPPAGYLKKALLTAGRLATTFDGTSPQNAVSNITPSGWRDIKLFEASGTLTKQRVVDTTNSGVGILNMGGHGNPLSILFYTGSSYFANSNVDALTNNTKRGIVYSMSCFGGAVDEVSTISGGDCFAEHFVNATGGTVAALMNSRLGWGDAAGTVYWSDAVDTAFYSEIFKNNIWHLGQANAASKDAFVAGILWAPDPYEVWPWVLYELTLFGDPETEMWTDEPGTLTANHNDTLGVGHTNFQVNVSSGAPIESALVCLMKTGEIYARGYTNSSGQAMLSLTPPATSIGTMSVTVTKHNYKPYEGTIVVANIGIEEIFSATNNSFEIIQNPTHNKIIFKYFLSNPSSDAPASITIYEPSGRIIKTLLCNIKSTELQMDSEELHNGIYFVKFKTGDFKETKKMVLVK